MSLVKSIMIDYKFFLINKIFNKYISHLKIIYNIINIELLIIT
jgi:hypothetical protein